MSVYVDEPLYRLGRMKMCHLMADGSEELLAMVDHIGVSRKWIQRAGEWCEHFDICKSRRALAVAAGAVELDRRTMVRAARAREEQRKWREANP